MDFRKLKKEEYEIIVGWWRHYGDWAFMPYEYLPDTSYVVSSGENVVAFASLYTTNSPFCVLEWITAAPSVGKEEKSAALSFLIQNIKKEAKNLGCEMMHTSTRIQSLIDRLKNEHDFFDHDTKLTALFTALSYDKFVR